MYQIIRCNRRCRLFCSAHLHDTKKEITSTSRGRVDLPKSKMVQDGTRGVMSEILMSFSSTRSPPSMLSLHQSANTSRASETAITSCSRAISKKRSRKCAGTPQAPFHKGKPPTTSTETDENQQETTKDLQPREKHQLLVKSCI